MTSASEGDPDQDASASESIILPRRFCGPPDSANGGYTAGSLARFVGGAAEVTLRRPPPLDRELVVDRENVHVMLRDGDEVVAEAAPTTLDIAAPMPTDFDTARDASLGSPFRDVAIHPFPTCFVCGPNRAEGDGLRLFAGRVAGTDRFATPWVPAEVTDEIVWSALDCPSCAVIYLDADQPAPHVLGRIAARIDRQPESGAQHVIMSWLLQRAGRKVESASAIYGSDLQLCAVARATWIRMK